MKCERWGSPLVQEKYQEEKACDKRHPYCIIIIIIIIIIITIIMQLSFHLTEAVLTPVQTKQIRINIHKQYNCIVTNNGKYTEYVTGYCNGKQKEIS